MTWVRVSLSYATFGIAIQDGKVVDAAPIAHWAIGKTEVYVYNYYRRKGAEFLRMTPSPDSWEWLGFDR